MQEQDSTLSHDLQYMQTNNILEKEQELQKDFYKALLKLEYLKGFLAILAYTLAIDNQAPYSLETF